MADSRVSVILLAHNEAGSIGEELREFHREIVARLPDCEFIVAEDGSSDGTREKIVEVSRSVPLRLVGGAERLGYGRALLGAIRAATGQWVFTCDGGMKHDPADFWRLHAVREQFDLVVGRKTNRTDQLHRRFFTWGLNAFLRLYFGADVRDADSGMRLMNRRVVEGVISHPHLFRGFNGAEIVVRTIAAGLRYGEVPIAYRLRVGESKGLPAKKIPRAISRLFSDSRALRRELRGSGRPD